MPDSPDTSDLRALARVILDQEDREQSAMRSVGFGYELHPVRRRFTKGLRLGFLLGLALGLASSGAGTAATFRQPGWFAAFVAFTVVGTAIGAGAGAAAGLVVRWWQRRALHTELSNLTRSAAT